ncbi:Rrf2 family transcriptional regulator [Hahella ganghwensis]|uniref:Rrf2 family transcriptional regulator n=1 Tax=Hahella ganghwensis TaxID=286420 RepID=UPI00039ACB36|nr:Rrf2 family transcriptional regulator [Hahella ganghwensis]
MQLTRFTDYALRTLIYLASQPANKKVALSQLAETFEMNLHHLNKVSQKLPQLGYLVSTRGKQGGVALARSPEQITVGEVIRDMEPCLTAVDSADCLERPARPLSENLTWSVWPRSVSLLRMR